MKDIINYYYNLDIDNIENNNDKYHFKYLNKDYFFVFYNRQKEELDDILICVNNMKEKGISVHEIIPNINNSYLTTINDSNYMLFSVTSPEEQYNIFDIVENINKLTLNNDSKRLYRNNWIKLWSDKIDYFEYQIRELGLNKEVVINSFSYYIGLAENAISYVAIANTLISKDYIPNIVWSHRRIFYPNYKLNYYNPLSFIFDLEIRDIAEYLKAKFFSVGINETMEDLKSYLSIKKLDKYMYHMLFARILYPTYYFDMYEEVMNKKRSEEDLIKIINEVDNYELFIKKVYFEISKHTKLEKIDWLIY